MKFNVEVEWVICGSLEIKAKSKEEAVSVAHEKSLNSYNGEYQHDSFSVVNCDKI